MKPSELAVSNDNYNFTCRFVSALAQAGVQHACLAPGYNNSPLVLAFGDQPKIQSHVFHDERTAAFTALGLVKALGEPVVIAVGAGTALGHVYPAVIEAQQARLPLIVLTADRPAEFRDVGERQQVDQVKSFGSTVKWFHDAAVPSRGLDLVPYASGLASRVWSAAVEAPAGPVHVNLPYREPKAPGFQTTPVDTTSWQRPVPRFLAGQISASTDALQSVADLISGRKALLIAGELPDRETAEQVLALGARGGFPVFADPLSFLRAGTHAKDGVFAINDNGTGSVDTDQLIRETLGLQGDDEPEVVVRFGAPVVSKAMTTWLAKRSCQTQVVIDDANWRDPTSSVTHVLRGTPGDSAQRLADLLSDAAPSDWTARWRAHVSRRRAQESEVVAAQVGFPSEPGVMLSLAQSVPSGSQILVAASMPIRDLDAFFPFVDRPITLASNRGASGIDGLVSTAMGMALSGRATATYLVIGDVALLHDLGSLRAAALHQAPLTVVAVNNDGGGIFHFVPQVTLPNFEKFFGTPHGTVFAPIAESMGVPAWVVDDQAAFVKLVSQPTGGPRLLEIRTDRVVNAQLHESVWSALHAL